MVARWAALRVVSLVPGLHAQPYNQPSSFIQDSPPPITPPTWSPNMFRAHPLCAQINPLYTPVSHFAYGRLKLREGNLAKATQPGGGTSRHLILLLWNISYETQPPKCPRALPTACSFQAPTRCLYACVLLNQPVLSSQEAPLHCLISRLPECSLLTSLTGPR